MVTSCWRLRTTGAAPTLAGARPDGCMLVAGLPTQLEKIKLDASADALMLRATLRWSLSPISAEYSSKVPADYLAAPRPLLSAESLQPLRRMADELRQLEVFRPWSPSGMFPCWKARTVTLADIGSRRSRCPRWTSPASTT